MKIDKKTIFFTSLITLNVFVTYTYRNDIEQTLGKFIYGDRYEKWRNK